METFDKKGKLTCAGAGGSLGLAALAGACGTGCGALAAPLAGLLSSAGLGMLVPMLPGLRLPLFVLALALGLYSMRAFVKRKDALGSATSALILGGGSMLLLWQMFAADKCGGGTAAMIARLAPESREVFQKGVYPLWPALGRAPTLGEVRRKLGHPNDDAILRAYAEIERTNGEDILFPGTQEIKWLWPFSSLDHGVEVTLAGARPVHARCAIDALGVSAMYGKPARVQVTTPLDGRTVALEISGRRLLKADAGVVVSFSDSCDDMLFFASREEFARYVKSSGKDYLKLLSVEEALARGIQSFGGVFSS
ncbi:MAG: hypothetical protein HY078_09530 [Elusimicrobia bacterium]|nr:hypothetical protein [Elusimicrobiota bacterium]